tara:strand:+ start:172 stop:387 length:216 start_codon:yes stop_codon:yes gene_type:complete
MYCEDCKHWKEPDNKMGECLKTINGWREGIASMSPNGWECGMYTGPRFGCVHFSASNINLKYNKEDSYEEH